MKKTYRAIFAALCVVLLSSSVHAAPLYINGFEPGDPGTRDFYDSTTGNQGENITIVANGGGVLGLTAPEGTHYAEVSNVPDAYSTSNMDPPGYGQSVYTDYGRQALGSGVIAKPFSESISIYINTALGQAGKGFWLDTTPHNDAGYIDETNFRFTDNGAGQVSVAMVGLNGSGSTSISTSGWYTFKTTFEDDGSGNVLNVMSVLDSLGNLIGSFTVDSSLAFSSLVGTGYGDWFTVWDNGYSGDVLGIDDVRVDSLRPVPEPTTLLSLACIGVAVCGWGGLKKRRCSAKSAD